MSALEELAALDEGLATVQGRARAVGRDLAEHNAKIDELRQRKIDAHSREDEQLAAKIRKQIEAAEAKVIDLEERQAGAQLAAQRADAERTEWRISHYRELLAEAEGDAVTAAQSLTHAIEQVEVARQHWHAVRHRIGALVEDVPGIDPKAIANIDATDAAIRELRKGVGPIEPPLPRQFETATIVAHDDPDPDVRDRARAEIREKAR